MTQGEQPWLLFRCWTKSHWKPVFIFLPKEDLACRIVHKTWGLFPPFPCDNFWFGQKTAKAFVRDRATGNDNTREYSADTDSDSSNRQTDRQTKEMRFLLNYYFQWSFWLPLKKRCKFINQSTAKTRKLVRHQEETFLILILFSNSVLHLSAFVFIQAQKVSFFP